MRQDPIELHTTGYIEKISYKKLPAANSRELLFIKF